VDHSPGFARARLQVKRPAAPQLRRGLMAMRLNRLEGLGRSVACPLIWWTSCLPCTSRTYM